MASASAGLRENLRKNHSCETARLCRSHLQKCDEMISWDDARVFLAVVRSGSHRGAGSALGVDATTVSRRLVALENAVAAKLLVRTPEGLSPTPAGRVLAGRAERMEAEALAAERELAGADRSLRGRLRVTATESVVHYVLLPALAEFRRGHPELELELRTETRRADLSRREADVAVRLGRPEEVSLVAHRLGTLRFALFASPAYLERRGTPRTFAALRGHDFVGLDASFEALPQLQWFKRHVPAPRYAVRANTTATQVRACAAGHGVALLPTCVTRGELGLHLLMPKTPGPVRELWGVVHPDLRDNPRCRAFFAWAKSELTLAEAPG